MLYKIWKIQKRGKYGITKKQISHALKLLETHSYKEVSLMTGISKSTLIRAKRERENI